MDPNAQCITRCTVVVVTCVGEKIAFCSLIQTGKGRRNGVSDLSYSRVSAGLRIQPPVTREWLGQGSGRGGDR